MKKPSDTKQKIFDAAAELFAESGYHAVSMRDIARKLGIRTGSIYNHYPSKEAIMDALLDCYLERMEVFYERMEALTADISREQKLNELLERMMFFYDPDEREFMYYLTRIVHHEQFTFKKAAESLIGEGYRRYMQAHVHYFDKLAEAGYITGTEYNPMYGELFARLSLTFATQFLHPEVEPTIKSQEEMYRFAIDLVLSHEACKRNMAAGENGSTADAV